ncbi:unnamed protein product, partial [Prorocentrum cordatum]
ATLAALPASPAAPPEATRGPGGDEEAVDLAVLALQADDECLSEAGAPSPEGGCAVVAVQRAARVVLEGGELPTAGQLPPAPPPGRPAETARAAQASEGTPAQVPPAGPLPASLQQVTGDASAAATAADRGLGEQASEGTPAQMPPAGQPPPSLQQLTGDVSAAAMAAGRGLGEQ